MIKLLFLLTILLTGCAGEPPRQPAPVIQSLPKQPAQTMPEKPKTSSGIKKIEAFYTVKQGDTLYSIGMRTGLGYWQLAEWNNIGSDYKVYVGQILKLFKGTAITADKVDKTIKKMSPDTRKHKPEKLKSEQKKSIISNNREKVLKLHWQWPARGKILKDFANTGHKGIDIEVDPGQSVLAAADGEVVYSGSGLAGYGQLLIIKHDKIYLSAYANNESSFVNEGQAVTQGQAIARCGKARSGKSSLHFEIRKNGKSVNPLRFLPAQ